MSRIYLEELESRRLLNGTTLAPDLHSWQAPTPETSWTPVTQPRTRIDFSVERALASHGGQPIDQGAVQTPLHPSNIPQEPLLSVVVVIEIVPTAPSTVKLDPIAPAPVHVNVPVQVDVPVVHANAPVRVEVPTRISVEPSTYTTSTAVAVETTTVEVSTSTSSPGSNLAILSRTVDAAHAATIASLLTARGTAAVVPTPHQENQANAVAFRAESPLVFAERTVAAAGGESSGARTPLHANVTPLPVAPLPMTLPTIGAESSGGETAAAVPWTALLEGFRGAELIAVEQGIRDFLDQLDQVGQSTEGPRNPATLSLWIAAGIAAAAACEMARRQTKNRVAIPVLDLAAILRGEAGGPQQYDRGSDPFSDGPRGRP